MHIHKYYIFIHQKRGVPDLLLDVMLKKDLVLCLEATQISSCTVPCFVQLGIHTATTIAQQLFLNGA